MAEQVFYRVTKECFFGGVWRSPDVHNIVSRAKAFPKGKTPSCLERIESPAVVDEEPTPDVEASDTAAELAAKHGIDLAEVEGTGADGAITKADVAKAISLAGGFDGAPSDEDVLDGDGDDDDVAETDDEVI